MNPVRAAIVTALQSVTDIGVVHSYERYAADIAKLKALYFSPTHAHVRGWFVRRVRTSENGVVQPIYMEVSEWQIRGVMSIDDDAQSELQMETLVDAIRTRFRQDTSLGGVVTKLGRLGKSGERGIQLDDFGPVLFGGVLCHGVRLSLTTTTERQQ